jgi:hypothetical protein
MAFNKPQTACGKDFNSSSALMKLSSMSRRTWSASPWVAITHDCEFPYTVLGPFTDRADTIHFNTVVKVYTRRLCSVQNWNASWRRWISCIYTGWWGLGAWWDDHWGMRRAVWRLLVSSSKWTVLHATSNDYEYLKISAFPCFDCVEGFWTVLLPLKSLTFS